MKRSNLLKRSIVFFLGYVLGTFLAVQASYGQTTEKALLWEISGKGLKQPSYLYGTIHITCDNGQGLNDEVKTAMENTEQLVLELDMDDPAMMQKMQKLSLNEGMQNFSANMAEEDKAIVNAFYKERFGAGLTQLGMMKPFVLMSMLYPTYLDCEKQTAVEMMLMQAAKSQEKEVFGLETVEEQMQVMDNIPMEEQITMLVNSIKEFEQNKADFKELTDTYADQDIVSLYESFQKYPEYAKYEDEFLGDRNKNWIDDIEEIITKKPSFIGVGAAHLASKNGVINLLREAGYTLKPILKTAN